MLRPVRVSQVAYNEPTKYVEGKFHGFGLCIPYQEHCGTMFNYTVAFVEQSDGSIIEAHPQDMVFLDAEKVNEVVALEVKYSDACPQCDGRLCDNTGIMHSPPERKGCKCDGIPF